MRGDEIKNKLHHYIDKADDKKLQAIYAILEDGIEGEYFYTLEELKMFYEGLQMHLDGTSKSYTVDEVFNLIRQNRKPHGL